MTAAPCSGRRFGSWPPSASRRWSYGEVAVPDEHGVTHIDLLTQVLRECHPERLA
jgi:hypothetical protein